MARNMFDVQVDGDDAVDQAMQALARGMPELGTRAAVQGAQIVRSHAVKDTIRRGEAGNKESLGAPIAGVLTSRTGALRSSIKVVPLRAESAALVGPTVKYGAIHEFGGKTAAHVIKPRVAQWLTFKIGGQWVKTKEVNHPGSDIPARPYLMPAYTRYVGEIREKITRVLADGVAKAIQRAGRMVVRFPR